MTAVKIIILDGAHSIPKGNLNRHPQRRGNQGFLGKESLCSELSGPQTGGVVSLNLFQPLIETERGRAGRLLALQPCAAGFGSARSSFSSGFCLTSGGQKGRAATGLCCSCTTLELRRPTFPPGCHPLGQPNLEMAKGRTGLVPHTEHPAQTLLCGQTWHLCLQLFSHGETERSLTLLIVSYLNWGGGGGRGDWNRCPYSPHPLF